MNTSPTGTSSPLQSPHHPFHAVVTGASSGIGAATVRELTKWGWTVTAVARRSDRLAALAQETGCHTVTADITDPKDREHLVAEVSQRGPLNALVNNAGGALGVDSIENGDLDQWRAMFEVNVIGALAVTQDLLPALRESGRGDIVLLTSTAAHDTYPGGGGYVAAKHAERTIANTLRLELVGQPIRVIEIAPGMVQTEEFSLNRLAGNAAAADAVYQGVDNPLVAADIADCIVWTLTRPHHVNIDSMIIRPRAQVSNTVVARNS